MSTERRDVSPNNLSPEIGAVIFDYGQVLAHRPPAEEFERMAKMFNVSFESFCELWETSRGTYDRGDFTPEEYWLKMAAQTNTSLDGEQIETLRQVEIEIWLHTDPDMLDWVGRLGAAGIKTGLLSNMPWDLLKYLRANCKWLENFTFKTFSAEVGLIKPDPAIYEHTLRGLGVAAAETLFVDDRDPNIQAARTLGMRAIQFQSVAQLRAELTEFGFPILPRAARSDSEASGAIANTLSPEGDRS